MRLDLPGRGHSLSLDDSNALFAESDSMEPKYEIAS